MRRREFLGQATALGAAAWLAPSAVARGQEWNAGDVAHMLPTVSDDRIRIKFSLGDPTESAPILRVAGRVFTARATDTQGRLWSVDATGLDPATRYDLALENDRGSSLCDPWPLTTFPAITDPVSSVRLLVFTCAGGRFLPMETKHRLLARALSFDPNAMIAIGDHVYWDLRRTGMGSTPASIEFAGRFDRSLPVLGSQNEAVLQRVVDSQVADLYETSLRSTPVFFVQDDHDYFENDEADSEIVTFPPDDFMMRLARSSQLLYYPEFLPDASRPRGLPGSAAADRPGGVSESFGTLRYGALLEMLLYDCRRFMTLKGPTATFVPEEVERWMMSRMAAGDTQHLVHVPSTPVGWTAGKWGEWYPDVLDEDGRLSDSLEKFLWQEGWRGQHDRLLAASSGMDRIPLWISGDLHSLGECRIQRSGDIDLSANPVVSVLSGPLGTGRGGWPSQFRGTRGLTPGSLDVDEGLPCLEENGFTLLDVTPDSITVRFFRWSNREDPIEAIDSLQPFRVTELQRTR